MWFLYLQGLKSHCTFVAQTKKEIMKKIIETCKTLVKRDFDQKETIKVITYNKTIYWSWGVSKLYNFEGKGLLLKVNGNHHKGYVLITLAWDDTYEVHIISTHGNVKSSHTDIYFDVLAETIDNLIERIPEYNR